MRLRTAGVPSVAHTLWEDIAGLPGRPRSAPHPPNNNPNYVTYYLTLLYE